MSHQENSNGAQARFADLSGREKQILGLAAAGLLDKNISTELQISVNTIRTYWSRIRQKSGNLSRGALTAAFVQSGLVPSGMGPGEAPSQFQLTEITDSNTLRRAAIYYATALQRVQDTLRKADRAGRVLGAYPLLCLRATSENELMRVICRILVEEGGYVMAWVGLGLIDEAKSVRVVASFGDTRGYLQGVKISWSDDALGASPTGAAIRTGKTQVYQDFLANPEMAPWRDAAMVQGYQSAVGFPLKSNSEVFGVITAYAREPDAFDENETSLLEGVASDVAIRLGELRKASKGAQDPDI